MTKKIKYKDKDTLIVHSGKTQHEAHSTAQSSLKK